MRDNAQSPHPVQAVRTPRAYCRAASPALPAVPGCCRIRPRWRCSRCAKFQWELTIARGVSDFDIEH